MAIYYYILDCSKAIEADSPGGRKMIPPGSYLAESREGGHQIAICEGEHKNCHFPPRIWQQEGAQYRRVGSVRIFLWRLFGKGKVPKSRADRQKEKPVKKGVKK